REKQGEAGANGPIKLSAEAKEAAGVRVEPARVTALSDNLTAPGTVAITPNRGARITPPASGKVARVLVELGATVQAGQPLVTLDSMEVAQARAAARQAESGVQQARAAVQTAQAET